MHALGAEVVERLGRVGSQVLLEHDERGHFPVRGQLIVKDCLIGAHEGNHTRSLLCDGTHPGQQVRVRRRGLVDDELGCAQDPGVGAPAPRTPLAGGREGDRPLDALRRARALLVAQVLPDRLGRRVRAIARTAREGAQHGGFLARHHLDATHADAAGGQRPRLVQAQAVDAGEHLDGGELLNEHAATGERRRSDREVHGGEQDEALRNHADDGRDGEDERLTPVSPIASRHAVLRVERQDDDGKQHDGHDLQHPVDRHLDLRDRARERSSLLRQPLRVDALADGRGDHAP